MKKLYILLALGLGSQVGFAQSSANKINREMALPSFMYETGTDGPVAEAASSAPMDTIMYENFAGGFPATWYKSAGFCPWEYSTTGPQGQFSTSTPPFAATSASNGFMLLDGDLCNVGGGVSSPGNTPMDAYFQTSKLDLSTFSDVILGFQHRFRYCCSPASFIYQVRVSNDSVSWTDFDVSSGVNVNTMSANALKTSLNITAVAGGQASVWIRFYVTGASHYFWQIDDILLTESPANNLVLNKVVANFGYEGGGYYTNTPFSQADTMSFKGYVSNEGSAAQSNVTMSVEITKGAASVYSATSNTLSTLPKLTSDSLEEAGNFMPTSTGAYTATFTVTQTETDDIISNNTKVKTFSISDTIYSRDNAALTGAGNISPSLYTGGDADESAIGNLFDFPVEAEASSMTFHVHTNSAIGSSFRGVVWTIDATTGDFVEFLSTADYVIDATNKKNKYVTLKLINTMGSDFILPANTQVIAGAVVYGDGSTPFKSPIFTADRTTEQQEQTTFIYLAGESSPTWYFVEGNVPFIRLNIKPGFVGLDEKSNTAGLILNQNRPNPSGESSLITFEITEDEMVSLEVYDINGKLVLSQHEGRKSAGMNSININTSKLANGVYSYTLIAGDKKATKRMVVLN